MSVRVLCVNIHEATGIRNVAWFGMSQDPYVLVRSLPSGVEVRVGVTTVCKPTRAPARRLVSGMFLGCNRLAARINHVDV